MSDPTARGASPARTTRAVERGVAVLLGADAASASGAVASLERAGRLHEGAAVHALILAARRGTDAAAAIAELSGGREPATVWSEYELRAAAEEAADDLRFVRTATTSDTARLSGPDQPVLAAQAVRQGVRTLRLPDPGPQATTADEIAARWILALAQAASCAVVREPGGSPSPSEDRTWERSEDYLDVLTLL